MTMEREQLGRTGKSKWRMFFAGVLFGVLASFLVLVALAFKYGPRGESHEMDLYSGHGITYKFFLWKRLQVRGPESLHVRWAIEHQNPVRSWYVFACSMSRAEWFEKRVAVDTFMPDHVYTIYTLKIPEEEKIKLLHQYHEGLDALKSKQQEYYESGKFMERFQTDWEQRLENVAQDGQLVVDPR